MKNGGRGGVSGWPAVTVRYVTAKPSNSARTSLDSQECAQHYPDSGRGGAHLVKVLGVRAELRVTGTRDEKIAAIARLQRGRVSRRQLRAAGLSYEVISRAVKRGTLIPLPGGVFAVGHASAVELGDETAALLALSDGAALSHGTASAIWEMRLPTDGPVHLVVPDGAYRRIKSCVVHRARGLVARDVRIRRGLPVTSPVRTLLDEGDSLTGRQLELAFDRALVARIMRPEDVAELLARTTGRRAGGALAALLDGQRDTIVTRSEAEELFLDLIRRAHLPVPKLNVHVHGYEVDFLWPEQRLIVEVDGYRFHSTRRAFEHDRRKEADLRAAGFVVLRFSYWQVREEPLVVVAGLTRALALNLAPAQVATVSVPSSREMATSTE